MRARRLAGKSIRFSAELSLAAWLSSNFVEHVLTAQRFSNSLCFVLRERMIGIGARDLENTVVKHHHSERAERDARRDDDLVNVVDTKATGLLDPVFEKGVAESVFSFGLGKVCPFDNETIFAHFSKRFGEQFSGPRAPPAGNFIIRNQKKE
jgi:hypothetical protein